MHMISETIGVERDNRNLVLSEVKVYQQRSDELCLDPEAIERLRDYLNREFPIRSSNPR